MSDEKQSQTSTTVQQTTFEAALLHGCQIVHSEASPAVSVPCCYCPLMLLSPAVTAPCCYCPLLLLPPAVTAPVLSFTMTCPSSPHFRRDSNTMVRVVVCVCCASQLALLLYSRLLS